MRIVYNRANFARIFLHIKSLLGISVHLIDAEKHTRICSSSASKDDFCELVSKNPTHHRQCQLWIEKLLAECKKTNKTAYCRCHAGLWEAMIPIINDDVIIGYISFGQVRSDASNCALDFKDKTIEKAYNQLPVFDQDNIEHMVDFISQLSFSNNILVAEEQSLVHLIATYIKENLQEDLSISVLCNMFDISKNHLYQFFHEAYGTSVNDYINQCRIKSAKKMLLETDDLVYVIAQKVGFDDCAYFSRIFKTMVGITPNQYRKQIL